MSARWGSNSSPSCTSPSLPIPSAAAAAHKLVEMGASRIRFVCLFAAPEGIELFKREHPDIPIYAAVIDRGLDDNAYIRPGVGDAGDRIYGTQ